MKKNQWSEHVEKKSPNLKKFATKPFCSPSPNPDYNELLILDLAILSHPFFCMKVVSNGKKPSILYWGVATKWNFSKYVGEEILT